MGMRALYALSGDPPTNGHAWVIDEIAKVAAELHIALAVNPGKKYMFDIDQRVVMMRAVTSHFGLTGIRVVIHDIRDEFLVRFARSIDATHLVRGIRSSKDYEYERTMAQVNAKLEPSISTWFLTPPAHLEAVSSSFVKGLMGLRGWEDVAARYVCPFVLDKLIKKWEDRPRKDEPVIAPSL